MVVGAHNCFTEMRSGSYLRLIDGCIVSLNSRFESDDEQEEAGPSQSTRCEQLPHRDEKRLVFKAHKWLYHSTQGSRVIKKKKDPSRVPGAS